MPSASWFAYAWPNRRSDKTVVEITLDFKPSDVHRFPRRVKDIRGLLDKAGILDSSDTFPYTDPPTERMAWYSSLLAQSALLFQRKAGHRVGFIAVTCDPDSKRCMVLVEHEHCDVGMTAVKLAVEMMSGERKLLAEPFRLFREFAQQRLLPRRTAAIVAAARARDIPVIHLERSPYKPGDWDALTGGKRICPNGLVMLGHGRHQRVLDGTWSLDLGEDLAPVDGPADDPDTELPNGAAERLLERLFPGDGTTRMPVVAITGTNGKTTTSHMVDKIARQAGLQSGLVSSTGTYLNAQMLDPRGACTDTGHLQVLTNRNMDIAVLESHHAGIMARGFCFDWCEVAVCLNVTEDHLGVGNIDTVEQMAELKRALPERARYAAVLNADDEHCLAMIGSMTARVLCLVSMDKDASALQAVAGEKPACFCVLECIDDEDWIVIHDGGRRIPLLAANRIPATFKGTARFNISNAMHAAMAAYQAGISPQLITDTLAEFTSEFENIPGRLNVFDEWPFKIIIDYAHNLDGYQQLIKFVDQQAVTGRKIVMLGHLGDRSDDYIRSSVTPLAGHFDHYVCRNYHILRGRAETELPNMLKEAFISAGVEPQDISVIIDADQAIPQTVAMAQPGDLLMLLADDVEIMHSRQIIKDSVANWSR
ncbi:MAG: Mur ligase family protein [Lysobacterales bacterium]|jgi:UDP-N-acetylmuramyl tripeptide synthase